VVRPLQPGSNNTVERIVDIRVDDHENPFKELRRLLYMTTGVPNRLVENAAKLSEQGRHREAIVELEKALAINPRSEQIQYSLAQRYAQAGDTSAALRWLAQAITRQPAVWKPRAVDDPLFAKLRSTAEFQRLLGR
jgi:tetratricopeptide (TPR) repeat protein